jgi:hypothetical protein
LDEAIEWTKRVPFQQGEIELRPLYELFAFPVDPAGEPAGWREKEEQLRAAPPARKPGIIGPGLIKADKETETGVLPDEKSLATMGALLEEGAKAGGPAQVRPKYSIQHLLRLKRKPKTGARTRMMDGRARVASETYCAEQS